MLASAIRAVLIRHSNFIAAHCDRDDVAI
jgi:hypothetical protein